MNAVIRNTEIADPPLAKSAFERSGADGSSRSPRPMSVLVMSSDPTRRADWAKFFEEQGMHAIRCAGPKATTCAIEIGTSCPLHQQADLIFYDQESITPGLEEQLDMIPLTTPIAYASTMRTRDGQQYPVTERLRSAARPTRLSR